MIVVRLAGGLGNQMFQYAVGRRLAVMRKTNLALDISSYETDTKRTYGLGNFRIVAVLAGPDDVERLVRHTRSPTGSLYAKLRWGLHPVARPCVIREREGDQFRLNPAVLAAGRNTYLYGYWQNEGYFRDIRHVLCSEFALKAEPDGVSRVMADRIESCVAVAVHVRRNDYVADPETARIHGACSLGYYQACARQIRDRVQGAHFFVFSDEPRWVHANLSLGEPMTVVEHNGAARDHEDLWLMSLCNHFIIANSSFSWWAAWLGNAPDKIVFAPRRWFAVDRYDTRDLLPSDWLKV